LFVRIYRPNFLYQGQELQDDLDLGWYSFKWRNHDPTIGRFFNIDPLSESFYYNSPYAFSENKVTGHVELEGLESINSNTLLKSAVRENVMNPVRQATESSKRVISGKVGVQSAGIGVKTKIGNVAKINVEGKAFSTELGASHDGATLSGSVVSTEVGLKLGQFEVSYSQDDIKTDIMIDSDGLDGGDVKLRDRKANVKAGNYKYSTGQVDGDNSFSLGVTLGNVSGEISANLDALGDYLQQSAEAIGNLFGNLVDSMMNPENYIPKGDEDEL
jgi:RHS repeat-associated protein